MKPNGGPEDLTREDAPFESQIRNKLGEDTVNLCVCVCAYPCACMCVYVSVHACNVRVCECA